MIGQRRNGNHARGPFLLRCASLARLLSPLLLWLCIVVVAVLARGLHWDESYEHAQIVAGQVVYPEGHPQAVYAHNAFTVQTGFSALLLRRGAGAWGVEFMRNVLFLLATVLPPFMLAVAVTKRTWPGHVAALLTLCGVFLAFDGSYPLMVWPETYSNGHIGGGWALVALALLVAGNVRLGALMFGLLPAVHVGQSPVLLGWMLCAAAWLAWNRHGSLLMRGVFWSAVGLALTAAYAAFHYVVLRVPIDAAITEEARELWAAFTRYHDLHRRTPGVNGQLMIAGTLVLSGLALTRRPNRWPHAGIALYTLGIAAAVWLTQLLTAVFGENLPFVFQAWMPYRMINHLPACFIALAMALLMRRDITPWPVVALAGYAIVLALMPFAMALAGDGAVGDALRAYLAEGDAVVFFLFGAAVMNALNTPLRFGLLAACVVPLAFVHQFGAACAAFGALTAEIVRGPWAPRPRLQAALIAAVLVILIGHQARFRTSLPVPTFQARVAALLQDRPDTLVVTEPFPFLWQAKTKTAIFTDATTHSLVSYLPALAPRIEAMYREVYGISLLNPVLRDYRDAWAQRDTTAWRALAERWGFTHVAAPAGLPIALPMLLEEGGWRLYAVAPSSVPGQE